VSGFSSGLFAGIGDDAAHVADPYRGPSIARAEVN
jgi:hypothetical protein